MLKEDQLILAIFSQIAYDYYPIRACKCQKIKQRIEASLETAKNYHNNLSSLQDFNYYAHGFGTAFKNEQAKKIVIAYTGTDFALPITDNCFRIFEEIIDDTAITFFDKPTDCTIARALKFVNQIKYHNPGCSLIITGHSLGGNIAERVAFKTKDPCISFNAYGTCFVYMTKERDSQTLSIRGTRDGLCFRKVEELSDNTLLVKDKPHKVSSFTGFDAYYCDSKQENKFNFMVNGMIALVLLLLILPFMTIFTLLFAFCYVACVRPKRKAKKCVKFIQNSEIDKTKVENQL